MNSPINDFTPPAAVAPTWPTVTTTGSDAPPAEGFPAPAGTRAACWYTYGSPSNRFDSMLRSHVTYVSPPGATTGNGPSLTAPQRADVPGVRRDHRMPKRNLLS